MIWGICFGLALVFLAAGTAVFLIRRQHGKSEVRYLGAGVFLACIAICFPVMCLTEQPGFAFAVSVSHSIRMFVVDTGVTDILDALPAKELGLLFYPYKVAVCLLYLLAPMFTLTIVLRYFSNFFERMRLLMKRRQNLYVFSELNRHSLEIASNISTQAGDSRKTGIIFCCSDDKDDRNRELEEEARDLKAVFVTGEMTHLRLRNRGRYIAYFFISEDEDKNIDHTLHMIEEMTGDSRWRISGGLEQRNTALYCYATGAEAEILLDAKEKEELRVVLMDEVRESVYEHLYCHPLYTNLNPRSDGGTREKISLLIAGGGKTGTEFLKAALWCGQMKNFDLEIHLIDIKGNLIRKSLGVECPELFTERAGYHIDIHKGNIFSSMSEKYLDELGEVNYCVAALGDDEANIRAAVWMRRYYYLKQKRNTPLICAYIENPRKRRTVWELYENTRTKEKLYYNIIPFGRRKMFFGGQSDAAFVTEYLGLGVQSHYFRLTKDSAEDDRRKAVMNFYEKQFNRRSSIASGIHIRSKLWELGYGIMRVPRRTEERKLFQQYIHPVDFREECRGRLDPYYELEHERWMAYVRTEGWRLSTRGGDTLEEIRECYEEYCSQFKNQNYLVRLHPALVPIHRQAGGTATLQEVDDMIVETNLRKGEKEYNPDYVRSDVELVDHIGDIVAGAWCGPEGISIHGVRAKEGECVICTLEDMLEYYIRIYQDQKSHMTSEEIITMREEIRRCCCGMLRTGKGGSQLADSYLAQIQQEEIM